MWQQQCSATYLFGHGFFPYLHASNQQQLWWYQQQQQQRQLWLHNWGVAVQEEKNSIEEEEENEEKETEEETLRRLREIREKLETEASTKLKAALKIVKSIDVPTELEVCIERAEFFVDNRGTDPSPRDAMDALRHITEAIKMCEQWAPYTKLHKELVPLPAKARDCLIVRAQLHALPDWDKKKYMSVLEAANGGRIRDEEISRLMQSYNKIIFEKFENAFASNNKKENARRGRPRPRRKRPGRQDRNQHGGSAESSLLAICPPPGLALDER